MDNIEENMHVDTGAKRVNVSSVQFVVVSDTVTCCIGSNAHVNSVILSIL